MDKETQLRVNIFMAMMMVVSVIVFGLMFLSVRIAEKDQVWCKASYGEEWELKVVGKVNMCIGPDGTIKVIKK